MILVVDDDHDYLALLTEILTSEGYNVRPSDSGELALASIASKQPELILLDIRMPGMGGFEVCRRIKARKETRDIPIIFLSGAYEAQERVEGLKLKAVDFISKPFHRDELTARVRTHLELSRLRSELELQVAQRTAALRAANELLKVELAERRRTEQALRESEERFRHLANRAPVGIWVLGPNQELLFRNTRTFTFAGRQLPQGGKEWTAAIHPEDLPNVQARYAAAVEAGRGFRIECRVCRANGKYRWVLNTGLPRFVDGELAGYIGTSVDITDLKRSHERMLATEKLESLGALTAGIAHDFNNLVGSIFAASDLALSDLPPGSAAREDIDRINVVATRASQLVNLLMAYTGGHNARRDRIDLSLVVAEMLSILKSTISSNATIQADLASDLPEVRANITEIRQVVLNLVMNASESLQRREGTIRVTTERMTVGRSTTTDGGCNPGEYCRLIVSDTGCGMPPEVRSRVFDPFYTTKCIGRGLGLSVVQGIVHSLGGSISCATLAGEGSAFEVMVPCATSNSVHSDHLVMTPANC